jgi:hypothetical protein
VPAGRYPACRWSVSIGEDAQPTLQHANLEIVRDSKLAEIPVDVPEGDAEPGGWPDYSGPFDPGFQLEDLSHRALVVASQEFAVQSHLLTRSFMLCAAQRTDEAAAAQLGTSQWTGIAALTAGRLHEALGMQGDDIESIAKVFQLHPCFHPRSYVDFRVEISGERTACIAIGDCPALQEDDPYSWFAALSSAPHPALDAIAGAINPRARCHPVSDPRGARLAWEIRIDPRAVPQPEPQELKLARMSRGASFRFERRRLPRS